MAVIDKDSLTKTELVKYTTAANEVVKLIIGGANDIDLDTLFANGKISKAAAKFTPDEVKFVIELANDKMLELGSKDLESEFAKVRTQFDFLYKKALLSDDYKTCADILMKKCKLLGLGETNKQTTSGASTVEIVHSYRELGDRTDVSINIEDFGDEKPPFPMG